MLTRIWHTICEWLAEPVYLQTVPWTWSVAEPKRQAPVEPSHAETLVLKRDGIQVWNFQPSTRQVALHGTWRRERYSLPETWREVRQAENQEENLS